MGTIEPIIATIATISIPRPSYFRSYFVRLAMPASKPK
jgi:hypothetical protein